MRHLWYKWLIILVGQIVILFTQKKLPTQYVKLDAKKSAIKSNNNHTHKKLKKEIETNKREIINFRERGRIQSLNRVSNFQNICRQSLSA